MMDEGIGWIYADWALCVLAFTASVAGYTASTNMHKGRIRRMCCVAIGFGWTLLSLRLFSLLSIGGDPEIAPISLIGLSLVSACYSLHEVIELNFRNINYGRRKDDNPHVAA